MQNCKVPDRNWWQRIKHWCKRKVMCHCPKCDSINHEHHSWQCAECGALQPPYIRDGICVECSSPYLDSVRECQNCEHTWNPRTLAEEADNE